MRGRSVFLVLCIACRSDYKLEGGNPNNSPSETQDSETQDETADSAVPTEETDTGCQPSEEVCDDVDNDCDGQIDEDLEQVWYADVDGDGHGDPEVTIVDCAQPSGYVDTDTDCDDTESRVPAEDGWCLPGRSCLDILVHGLSDGDGRYRIDPEDDGSTFEVRCDMSTDGGGWTLLVVTADDGQTTFTWNTRDLWGSDTTPVGRLDEPERDFKSPALHDVQISDLLAVHAPSGVWAAYSGVGDGTQSASTLFEALGGVCYGESAGYPMTAGTLTAEQNLCSTDLFINAIDQDGTSSCSSHDDGWGPGWSTQNNVGCPLDDVGHMGFGPNALYPDDECGPSFSTLGMGFGWALGLNTGELGSGENHISLWGR